VATVSFSYTVGSARFSTETEVDDWDDLDQEERVDRLLAIALSDVEDMIDVEEDSINDD